MENDASEVDVEKLWACASREDIRRTAELARDTFRATQATVVPLGIEPKECFVASCDRPGALAILAADSDSLSDGADEHHALLCTSLRQASGRELGLLRVTAPLPRNWSDEDQQLLAGLATQLVNQIELRYALTCRTPEPRDARAKLMAVADRIPGLVFERRKLDAGRSAYTFFGSGKTELPAVRQMMESGVSGLNFVHRDDREAVRTAILRSNLEETDLDLTFRIKDLDRSIRWVRSQSVVRHESDGTTCWNGLCFDVTDLVAAREEAARTSREALLANISRELRDPLQAVLGLAQLITVGDQPEPASSHAHDIRAAAESMIEVIDRMLGQDRALGQDGSATVARNSDAAPADTRAFPDAESGEAAGKSGLRILLADDLDLNRKLVSDMLTYEGHIVDCVADGAEALSAVRTQTYDLILMDMIMPVMDGVAATRAIRAMPAPACRVPIIALTANAMHEQLDQCLEAGMDAALTKPMSMEDLANVVTTWTRRKKAA